MLLKQIELNTIKQRLINIIITIHYNILQVVLYLGQAIRIVLYLIKYKHVPKNNVVGLFGHLFRNIDY